MSIISKYSFFSSFLYLIFLLLNYSFYYELAKFKTLFSLIIIFFFVYSFSPIILDK